MAPVVARRADVAHGDAPGQPLATRGAGVGLAGGESAAAGACRESQGSRSVDIVGLRGSVDIVGLSGGGALVAVGARSAAPKDRRRGCALMGFVGRG